MPTYRYRCAKCGDELEQWQSFSDAPLTRHAECGGRLAKVLSTPGIVLKGSGFYRTDSRNGSSKRSKPAAESAHDGPASGHGASGDGASGDGASGDGASRDGSSPGGGAREKSDRSATTGSKAPSGEGSSSKDAAKTADTSG